MSTKITVINTVPITHPDFMPLPWRVSDAHCIRAANDRLVVNCHMGHWNSACDVAELIVSKVNAPTWTIRNADGTWPALPKEGEQVLIVVRPTCADMHMLLIPWASWFEGDKMPDGRYAIAAWSYPPAIPNFTTEA